VLYLGNAVAAGTYGSTASAAPAANQNDTYFTSTSSGTMTSSSSSRNFYVNDASTTGDTYTSAVGSNSNAGTAVAPFLTIAYAISQALGGDIIYVDAGTYTDGLNINKSLTVLGPNAAISPNTGTRLAEAVIDFNNVLNTRIGVTGSISDLAFKGFEIKNANNSTLGAFFSGFGLGGNPPTNSVIENNWFHDIKGETFAYQNYNVVYPTANIIFNDNKIENVTKVGTAGGGIRFDIDPTEPNQVSITNNVLSNVNGYGFNATTGNGTYAAAISGNKLTNITDQGIAVYWPRNLTISNN
jgi:hypothetical protein